MSEQGQLPLKDTDSSGDDQNVAQVVGLPAILGHSDLVSEAYWELVGALNPSPSQFKNMRENILLLQRSLEAGALDTRITVAKVVQEACEVLLPLLRLAARKLDSFEEWHQYHVLLRGKDVTGVSFDEMKDSYNQMAQLRDDCYKALEDFRDALLRAQAFMEDDRADA